MALARSRLCPLDTRQSLALILLAGLAARLALTFFAGVGHIKPDSKYYLAMADAILAGAPISDFPNGLPLLIAGAKLITGTQFLNLVLALNVAMSTATVALVFLIARRLLSAEAALAATAIAAFWPNQLNYVPQLMSEVPAAFALTLGLYLALSSRLLAAGLALYVAGLVRTTVLPVGILLIPVLAIAGRRRDAGVLAGGLALGWLGEHALQWAGIIEPPSNLALNLLVSISNTSTGGMSFDISHFSDYERAHPLATHLSFIAANPGTWLMQKLSAAWELWGPWPSSGYPFSNRSFAERAMIGLRFPLFALGMAALAWGWRRVEVTALALPALSLIAVHVAFFANARFSYPAEPMLAVLAVMGALELARRWTLAVKPSVTPALS